MLIFASPADKHTKTRKQSMYQLESPRERHLLWLLALTQFTLIMDFMVMMPLGPQIMAAFAIGPAAFATAVSAFSWCAGLSGLFAASPHAPSAGFLIATESS